MFKKVLAMLTASAMVVGMLAGCGSKSAESAPADSAAESVVAESGSEDASAAEDEASEASEAEAVDASALKIGCLINTVKEDGGWCQAQWIGVTTAAETMGMNVDDQVMAIEGVNEETVATTNAVEQMIEEGCNVIMGLSTGYAPTLNSLAKDYPDVLFMQAGVPQTNIVTYHCRQYQAMYAIGHMMAKLAKADGSDEIGYVAGMSEASVRFSINGFALGAKAANPDAKVNVVWASSWYDPAKEAECANTLIASGIKYIGTGTTSPGAPEAAEAKGCFTTGYDLDHTSFAPESVLASSVFNWEPIFVKVWTEFLNNGMKPFVESYFWGAAEDCSQIAFNDDLVDAETKAETEDILAQIAAGDIDVFAGEIKSNEGEVLVNEGETMDDTTILDQSFFVDNIVGSWQG